MRVQILGIPWYRPETFARLLSIFEDSDKFSPSYEEWLALAERMRKRYESQGIRVICVDIDPDEFPKWCVANGYKIDTIARQRYAGLVAYRIATGRQSSGTVH